MPAKKTVNKKDRAKAVRLYVSGNGGVGAVASLLGISGPVARRILVEEGVAIRGQGRPAKVVKAKTKTKTRSRAKKAAVAPVEVAETVEVAEEVEEVAE